MHLDLLAVQGTTDIRISCLVLTHKITQIVMRVQESIVSVETILDMHLAAADVAPSSKHQFVRPCQVPCYALVRENVVTYCCTRGQTLN